MANANDQVRKPELGSRYGEIGISAVAAALHYKSGMRIGAVEQRRVKRTGPTDEIQKSDGVGNSCQMRSSRPRNR
jgi:hypothetical protein